MLKLSSVFAADNLPQLQLIWHCSLWLSVKICIGKNHLSFCDASETYYNIIALTAFLSLVTGLMNNPAI